MNNNRYLPIGEAANFLGVSIGVLRKFEETGKIVPLKTLSGVRRYSFADLQKIKDPQTLTSVLEELETDTKTETEGVTRVEGLPTRAQVNTEHWREGEPVAGPPPPSPRQAPSSRIRDFRAEGINPYQATGLLSVEQVASKMGVSSRTIRRLIAKGKLRPATTGKYGSILIPTAHVDNLVNGFQKTSDSPIALPALAPSTQAAQVSARKLFFLNAAFVFVWLSVIGSSIFLGYTLAPEGVREGVRGRIAAVLFGEGLVSPTPTIIEQTKQALISNYLQAKDGNKVDYKVFFEKGIEVGTNTLTIDSGGQLTTSEPLTITDTSVSSLKIGGGLVAGTGNVYIIDKTGRIPALTSTYIADLDATALTGKIDNADHLDGIDSSSFLRSNESDTAEGAINFTAKPGSVNVGGGPVYINPAASTADYTLFGVAINNSSRFKVDAEGDTSIAGTLGAEGATTLSSTLAVTGNTTLSGNLAVNGGSLTTSATTFNLVNATATTVNFAGVSTALSIGASTGTTTINNALTVTGATTLSSTLGVTGASTFTGNLTVDGRPTFTKAPTSAHTGTWVTGVSTWNQSDATIYINPATATADSNLLGVAVGGSVKFDVDAEGDIHGRNLILEGSTTSGTTTIAGDLSIQGNTTIGDATTDTLTVNPATLTWAGGNKTLDITGAATRTLTLLNSTASQVADLDLSDGDLKLGGTVRISNAGAVTAVGVNSGAGLLQGALGLTITGATVSLNASSNFGVNIATGTSTGAIAIGGGTVGQTVAIDSADWDITTTGAMTGIGAITMDGNFSQTGTTTLSTGTGAISLNGATTVIGGSNFSLASGTGTYTQTNAQTTDATADALTLTLSAGGTGATGTLRGLVISQSDTSTTGVFDSLAYITNLKTPETTTNGLFIDQNAASGTLTNALHITNTAGTLTTAILVDGTAPGSFILDTGSLDISGAGAITGATGVSTTTVTATGLLQTTLTTEQLRLRYDASNYLSTTVGATGAVTFDATGSGQAFTISDALTASSTLTVSGASITASSASLAIGGALSGATTVTGSGNINTTGGALQTNSVTRIDNSGNVTAGTISGSTITTTTASGTNQTFGNNFTIRADSATALSIYDSTGTVAFTVDELAAQ